MAAAGPGWQQLARGAARGAESAATAALREYLCFELAGAPFALPVEDVREIARLRAMTKLPRAPEELLGVISLRGQVLCVFDLRRRLSLPAEAPARGARIAIVSDPERGPAGLLVDRVRDVLRSAAAPLRPAGTAACAGAVGLLPWGGEFVTLLDCAALLGRHD